MSHLYTLIMDYDGGTYVSQVVSDDLNFAASKCIESWDISGLENVISELDKKLILMNLKYEEFTPLKGIINVWCGSVLLKGKFIVMNLVLTINDL
ncbi:hypothetical protein ACSVIJ_25635 [Pseudomonas sp. NCHU5208]|uniref:hypothetical protein n=1 Tax=unclassified Pseudomonas TaxID=196821 RepID=UPI003F9A07EC